MSRSAWLLLLSVLGVGAWLAVAWVWEMHWAPVRGLPRALMLGQDVPALLLGIGGLLLAVPFLARVAPAPLAQSALGWIRDRRVILPILLLVALLVFAGTWLLFDGYALSRDEEVADMAAAAMQGGRYAIQIPPEWAAYRRAIMPEFFLPFGADHFWTAAYLPVNSALRAMAGWLGTRTLAGPLLLTLGLFALWRIALRLFPARHDAVLVVMAMALSSPQLWLTAMTPYAMTGHFALNLVWLALVLHDRRWSHGLAALVTILLVGLHQWHFPLIFLAPFLMWFALGRRWALLMFHGAAIALAVLLWAKAWPALLLATLGAPADVLPARGIGDKVGSLFARLDKWHPALHWTRFLAWNNLLIVPLAALGAVTMDWRAALRGQSVALPLMLGCLGAGLLAIDQGYGWGYRYLHGYTGPLALLAGLGWARLRARSLAPVVVSLFVALLTGSFLVMRAESLVAPYATAHQTIMTSGARVVLIDPRGGRFVTDLVRGVPGDPLAGPVVMNIGGIGPRALERLCKSGPVTIFDSAAFLPLGIKAVKWDNAYIAAQRARLVQWNCGVPIALKGRPD